MSRPTYATDSLSRFCVEHADEPLGRKPIKSNRIKRTACRALYWLSGAFAGAIFIAFTYDKISAYPAGLLMGLCLVLAGLTGCKGGLFK